MVFPGLVVTGMNGGFAMGGLEWLLIPGAIMIFIGIAIIIAISAKAYQEGRKAAFKTKS